MEGRTISPLERNISEQSPEKLLWICVVERMLIDFNDKLAKKKYFECDAMLRSLNTDHLHFICDVIGVHPDKLKKYMTKKLIAKNYIPKRSS